MATFEQFRDSFPADNDAKGKAFEAFLADWFFLNHPEYKNKFVKVWRYADWPKPKGVPEQDLGTDLIAKDTEGKVCAIQAKFYAADRKIKFSDIATFLADSSKPYIDYRLLVGTAELANNAKIQLASADKPVYSFLLNRFLDWDTDWPSSLADINNHKQREPYDPKPHQEKAINDVCTKLNGRGQLIMACGTGKTLTGQRIAEKLEAKTTLVLLPSLLLLRKTVTDWLVEAKQDFLFLPVCSDKRVTKKTEDEIEIGTSDLGSPATTDSNEIASFIKRRGNKVIFSTYQSSPKIAEAFTKHSLKPFDLIIADEAHRCAGKITSKNKDSDYSTVLKDSLIPAKHRLFMTATPRIYTASLKKKAENKDIELASMDDENVFGPVLHHLTFGQAIANDPPLLTDYRVLVIGVNKDSVKEMVEERTLVRTEEGVEDDARSLAIQVGLAKAIRDYDLKRVITFHSKISLAKNFASSFNEFKDHLKEDQRPSGSITYEHVSGKMPTSERSNKLRALGALKDEDRYLLANARCLSEGVDVPALDGVAFVDPKRSEIDIIQAVGRAIRLSDDKETGTIVIPVFLSDSDDPDEVISASEFDQVWKVVNALRSHDESLGEELDELRVQIGRKQKISLRGSRIVFDVHQQVGDEFIEAFDTKLVETSTASWGFMYGLLEVFKERNGHCRVPIDLSMDEVNLGAWVGTQRTTKQNLSAKRRRLLDALSFIWNVHDDLWYASASALSEFKTSQGHCNVPTDYEKDGVNLYRWSQKQRSKNNSLTSHQKQILDDIGFDWDPTATHWEKGFVALVSFKKEHGHLRVPKGFEINGINLSSWMQVQKRRKNSPSDEKKLRLDNIGFEWDVSSEKWEAGYLALETFKRQYGHCLVPKAVIVKGINLSSWVKNQRTLEKNLSAMRHKRLTSLGFIWNVYDANWEEGFKALEDFKKQKGHCRIRAKEMFNGFALGRWQDKQRQNLEISTDRKLKLDSLGFIWDPFAEQWEEGFAELIAFKQVFGHCNVPQKYKRKEFNLGVWVSGQRANQGKLNSEREKRLTNVGFVWSPRKGPRRNY